jgi:acetyl esterase/lipase
MAVIKNKDMWKGLLFFLVIISCTACKAQEVIPLYKGTAPGVLTNENKESTSKSSAGRGRSFTINVTVPDITVYHPAKQNAARSAVIISPGGGYSRLSIIDGGHEAAKVFADAGITAIVLKYRTWQEATYTEYKNIPLQDLQQAMKIVGEHSEKWNIDREKTGLLGFSAGGHLTAMAATSTTGPRPAFTLLIYPVISFMDSLTSKTSGSRSNLLGKKITKEEKIVFSPELHTSATTPPAFLVHAENDSTSLVGNSIAYYQALMANKVPVELLVYKKGGHGFAMYNEEEKKYWFPSALEWMRKNGFYK